MKAVFGKFLYEDLAFCLEAFNLKESEKLFEKIEQLRGEFYFLGYVKYEFYRYLVDKDYQSYEPFAFFYAFKKRAPFTPQKTDDDAFLPRICKKLDKAAYKYNDKQILADMIKCLKEKGICNESVIGE